MDELKRLYPTINVEHLRTVAGWIAEKRDDLARRNDGDEDGAPWGFACHACEKVMRMLDRLDKSGGHPWLRYIHESGMAYTILVDGIPLRVQPQVEEIRDVYPGERAAMSQKPLLPGEIRRDEILRLEISQLPAKPVTAITLFLFEENTGITLDTVVLYRRDDAQAPGVVIPFTRPPQDADTSSVFEFHDEKKKKTKSDGERGEK